MTAVAAYERDGYRLLATPHCYVFEFERPPIDIDAAKVLLGDGSVLHPGDCITTIGGKNTAAGFTTIKLSAGHLIWAGFWNERRRPDTYALFRYSRIADPTVFFGGIVHSTMPLSIFHSTPAVAGRRIETTLVVRGTQE